MSFGPLPVRLVILLEKAIFKKLQFIYRKKLSLILLIFFLENECNKLNCVASETLCLIVVFIISSFHHFLYNTEFYGFIFRTLVSFLYYFYSQKLKATNVLWSLLKVKWVNSCRNSILLV